MGFLYHTWSAPFWLSCCRAEECQWGKVEIAGDTRLPDSFRQMK
jgi:hypothetical protein